MVNTDTIILIGPIGVGKSTVAKLLAEHLHVPLYSIDAERWKYFAEIGYDEERQKQIGDTEGIAGVLAYWQPFEVHAVERMLAEYHNCVIDFGGGYSIQDDPLLAARVRQALAPCRYLILLLPSPSLDETVEILRERTAGLLPEDFDMPGHVTKHFSTREFARWCIRRTSRRRTRGMISCAS
jgi:shikimate kinase